MAEGVKIDVKLKNDGFYLSVAKDDESAMVSNDEIMKAIMAVNAKNIDYDVINNVINSRELVIERKVADAITEEPVTTDEMKLSLDMEVTDEQQVKLELKPKDESKEPEDKEVSNQDKVIIEVSRDRMEAKIKFVAGGTMSEGIPLEKITKAIEDAKVRYGIMDEVIQELTVKKLYDTPYLFAVGKPPTEGKNGYIDLKFDTSSKTYKPKIMQNGKADYRELELVKIVNSGQLLAVSIPPIPGEDGMNVLGQVVAAKHGRPAPALPNGKNVAHNDDNTELYATSNGQIIYDGSKKISISPVLELPGNVDNSTGNINFNGAVVIKGSVLSGFSVTAEGNIEVLGVVEGAFIKSDNHVFLYSGVKGSEKATIQAKGDITVKYAENCTMEAGRNIIASCIIYCNVTCGGYLEISGKNGSLVGGKAKINSRVEAVSIGSPMAANTEIEVGINPNTLDGYRNAMEEFNRFKDEYLKIEKLVGALTDLNRKGQLDEQKKSMLLKSIQTKIILRQRLDETQKKIDSLMPKLGVQNGLVVAREVVYSGVKLMIGNAVMYVRDDIRRCTLKNIDGKIVIDRI